MYGRWIDIQGELKLLGHGTGARVYEGEISDISNQEITIVPISTIEKICREYIKENADIHFLKIDVEGYEKQVLCGANFREYRPWIVVIESALPGTKTLCHEEWEDILEENNYIFARQYGINRYYVSREKEYLKERFQNEDEIKSKYIIYNFNDFLEYDTKLAFYRNSLDDIYNGESWKITKPLRVLKKFFTKRDKK